MGHILAKLKNVDIEDIRKTLIEHKNHHENQWLFLEHVWKNIDQQNEVFFIFRTDNLSKAKEFITTTHKQALKEDPNATLPEFIFLDENK